MQQTWHGFSSELQGQHARPACAWGAVDAARVQGLGTWWAQGMAGGAEGSSAPTASLARIVRPDWWQEGCWSPCWIALVLQEEVLSETRVQQHLTQAAASLPDGPKLQAFWWCYPRGTPQGQPSSTRLPRWTYRGKIRASISAQSTEDGCV